MQKFTKKHSVLRALILCFISVLFTLLTKWIDVKPIGPEQSQTGFATINVFVHELFGVHMIWYYITDWLGLVPVFISFGFAIVGLAQLLRRKSLFKVDKSIIVLGIFYIILIALYVFFEKVVINYRPVLINGNLEASYPSSHTLMTICIMFSAITECEFLTKSRKINVAVKIFSYLVIAVTVIGRLVSGVHWFTDILGGILISFTWLEMYFCTLMRLSIKF